MLFLLFYFYLLNETIPFMVEGKSMTQIIF
jgi:hypothetical protein